METAQRIEAVRSRLRELKIDELTTETVGGPCVKCVHFKRGERGFGSAIGGKNINRCRHIVHTTRHFDPIERRYVEAEYLPAIEARSEGGLCGPEGILFDPGKPKLPPLVNRAIDFGAYTVLAGLGAVVVLSLF